ncbi:hypothetical protein AJ87_37865 [Rhizobium yanglingense]|nr:hypothetical protein AJ87_37865 [Rhizobium yanglingense]
MKPELVAEVEFRAWSADGNLRHAAFRGLREDKLAKDVVREMEKTTAKSLPKSQVTLTHPDRIYWPDEGVTKEGLANYYAQVWRFMDLMWSIVLWLCCVCQTALKDISVSSRNTPGRA